LSNSYKNKTGCFRQPETRFLVKSVAIDALCLRSTKKGNFPEVRRKSLAKYPQNAAKHAACWAAGRLLLIC